MQTTKHLKSFISSMAIATCLSQGVAHGVAIQFFPTLAYTNPASLALVKTFSTTAGGVALPFKAKFKGNAAGVSGSSKSSQNYYFPYFQAVWRPHPMWVVGFDMSDPLFGNFVFKNGILNGERTRVFSKNYSPKVCFQPMENLAFGFGVDIQQVRKSELSIPLPPGLLRNTHLNGVKAGWDAGFLYMIAPTSILSGSFHSQIKNYVHATSTINGASVATKIMVPTPAVATLNFLQILNKEWLVNLTVRYCKWDLFQNLVVNPTPLGGPLVLPAQYHNSWVGQAVTRYQFAEQWACLLALEFDSSAQGIAFRPTGLPTDKVWIAGVGLQYLPTDRLQFQFVTGYGWSRTNIRNFAAASFGKEKVTASFFDLSVTYKF
jgi:long-subunit fatty acid transport protein